MSRLDELAELLLSARKRPIPPDAIGFVYVHRGGELSGVEALVEAKTRTLADEEARCLEKKWGGELLFVREQKASSLESPLLTREEAAAYLRIGVRTLARQDIAAIRIGGRVFYTREILDAWLDTKRPRTTCARKPVERSSTTAPAKEVARKSPSVSRTILTEADLKNVALLSRPRKPTIPTDRHVQKSKTTHTSRGHS